MNEKNGKIPKQNKRILFMDKNLDKGVIQEIASGLKDCDLFPGKLYALYDYDVIILNLPSYLRSDHSYFNSIRNQVESAMRSGKIIYCVADSPKVVMKGNLPISNYSWTAMEDDLLVCLKSATGETITVNKSSKFYDNFKDTFSSFKFIWGTDLKSTITFLEGDVDILAVNSGNYPVSFVFNYKEEYGNGKVIFIPQIREKDKKKLVGFYIALINTGLTILKPSKTTKAFLTPTPSWIEDYKIKGEEELLTNRNEIDLKLTEFFNVKKLLYESGTLLVKPVSIVFEKLGYVTDIKEEEGAEDIKIKYNEFQGLVEVKGFKTAKNIDKTKAGELLGQLIGHLKINYPDVNYDDIKLVLVVNYNLNKTPKEREKFVDIFTAQAIKIFESNVCVLSTLQLFEIYNDILFGEKTEEFKSAIRNKIEKTNGIFQLNGF